MDYSIDKLREKLKHVDGERLYKRCLSIYNEKFLNVPIEALTYSKFKLIYQTGNRSLYQEEYLLRRERLALLQILSIYDVQYVEEMENVIAAICDEFTWIWPAHCLSDKENGEFDYSIIDLYSAQAALYLSETLYLFDEYLTKDIKYRIKKSIKEKVLDCFESRTFWWERKFGTNWTGVCGAGVGIAYLYAYPERFVLVKDRIFALMEDYMRGIHEDGLCEEGPAYWAYGFGFLCLFVDIYKQKFNEIPEFLDSEKIKKTINYYHHSVLGGKYIQIGDQTSRDVKDYTMYELFIKKVFPETFLLPEYDFVANCPIDSKPLLTRILDSVGRYEADEKRNQSNAEFSTYYRSPQIFLFSNKNYAFSVKGGHNHEMHNHNDIGAFTVLRNGKKIISDYGAGEYNWAYFEDPEIRYSEKTFTCGSCSHSVPIIDGLYQKFGGEYKAEYIQSDDKSITFDIAKAYGLNDESMIVKYTCDEESLTIAYKFQGNSRQLTFRFLSDFEPTLINDKVYIEGVCFMCNKQCDIKTKKWDFKGYDGKDASAYTIDFIFDKYELLETQFVLSIEKD